MTSLLVRRATAYVADILALFLTLAPAGYLAQRMIGYVPGTGLEVWYALLAGFSLPAWGYFALSDRSERGATLGKRLLGLRVSTTDGERLSVLRAMGRTAAKLLPWELAHASAFALSADLSHLSIAQTTGLVVANLLALAYLGTAVATGGRRSVHDLVVSTEVRSSPEGEVRSSPEGKEVP